MSGQPHLFNEDLDCAVVGAERAKVVNLYATGRQDSDGEASPLTVAGIVEGLSSGEFRGTVHRSHQILRAGLLFAGEAGFLF